MFGIKKAAVAAVSIAAIAASGAFLAAPASAAASWRGLQSQVDFTVYVPTVTYSMERTTLELNRDCEMFMDAPRKTVAAVFKKSSTKKIKIFQSDSAECLMPGGLLWSMEDPYKTFEVQDGYAEAEVWVDCMGSGCPTPSKDELKETGAWVRVNLDGTGGPSPTDAFIYSKGFSYSKIKDFVWSLAAVDS